MSAFTGDTAKRSLKCQIPSLVSNLALGSNRFETTLLTLEILGDDVTGTVFSARWA